MSALLCQETPSLSRARLLVKLVCFLVWCGITLGLTNSASAGCDFGHPKLSSSRHHDMGGYARSFRVLGQWIYEAGEIKYVAWQAEGTCDGPNCSGNQPPRPESSGMSLPQTQRIQTSVACGRTQMQFTPPLLVDVLRLKDAQALHGYPPAYEYPP